MSKEASHPRSAPSNVDDASIVYRTVHDWDGREPLSDTVIRAISEAAGLDPTELSPPLIESVDPDALDALFRPRHDGSPRRSTGRVAFTTGGHEVVVHGDGRVVVFELIQT